MQKDSHCTSSHNTLHLTSSNNNSMKNERLYSNIKYFFFPPKSVRCTSFVVDVTRNSLKDFDAPKRSRTPGQQVLGSHFPLHSYWMDLHPVTVEPTPFRLQQLARSLVYSRWMSAISSLSNWQPFTSISASLFGWTWNEFIPHKLYPTAPRTRV